MRLHFRFVGVVLGGLLAMGQAPIPGRAASSGAVVLRAEFRSYTSLRVSSSLVQFDVTDALTPPTAVVDFTAAARTIRGGGVVLTVETDGEIQSPEHGPAARDLTVTYEGAE